MNANSAEPMILGCEQCRKPPAAQNDLILEYSRSLYLESQEGYDLYRCPFCGQMYLEQYFDTIDWVGGEDDLWQRWMPLTSDELAEVNQLFPREATDYDEVPRLTALMHRRGRLTKDPEGEFFWAELPGVQAGCLN